MFNFTTLKLDKRADTDNLSSFVGIRRNQDNILEFRLPKGFENFPENDFDATKQLFFRMYRTFKKFEEKFKFNGKICNTDEKSAGKDNIEIKGNAYKFKDKEDNEVLLYSKISVIENLLDAYQDLALDVIERRVGRNERIDYSKIDQYLHKAIYLPDDVIFLDEMELPRHTLLYDSATLIDLFCFILYELESELEQESDTRVRNLAVSFREEYLSCTQSLFNEESFEVTITSLKDILNDIDKVTAYKDDDYWRLYEAIESFLYGELDMQNTHENGIFWGISNFWEIWEDMGNTYAFTHFNDGKMANILYADTNIALNGKNVANSVIDYRPIFQARNFENPFFIEFRGKKRWMRPDLVYSCGKPSLFEMDIQVKIDHRNENYGTVDFTVTHSGINDDHVSKAYNAFIHDLKKGIRKCQTGARVCGVSSFKSYSIAVLENIKKHINGQHQKANPLRNILLDWKYMTESDFLQKSDKLDQDITKQLCYELSLKQVRNDEIESQFVIPCFYLSENDDIGFPVKTNLFYSRIGENNIVVFKANFQKMQEVYLIS